jgi:KipI family sensor histidine kinase inhibitor
MAGDATLLVEFAERIDPRINQRVIALAHTVREARLPGVRDVVPAYRTVGVSFDPLRTDLGRLLAVIDRFADEPGDTAAANPALVRVPVCYGGDHGPDLAALAAAAGLTAEEAIECHCAPLYRVFMIGFIPGFAYLGLVDERLAAPRRAEPRLRVPAGSVGIAGRQTGIYPTDSPGGWMLIGRTPLRPFDLEREPACLFEPGDAVQFYPIDPSDYAAIERAERLSASAKAPKATPERGQGTPSEGVSVPPSRRLALRWAGSSRWGWGPSASAKR